MKWRGTVARWRGQPPLISGVGHDDDNAIHFDNHVPSPGSAGGRAAPDGSMCIRHYPIDYRVIEGLRQRFVKPPTADRKEPGDDDDDEALLGLREFFVDMGVPFPEGSHIAYYARTGGLLVRNTQENITRIESVLHLLGQLPSQIALHIQVGPSWSLRCVGLSGNAVTFGSRLPESALASLGNGIREGLYHLRGEATSVTASDGQHIQLAIRLTLTDDEDHSILGICTELLVTVGEPVTLLCVSADGTEKLPIAVTTSLVDAKGKPIRDSWPSRPQGKDKERPEANQ